jgi:hypothetical protein
MCNNEALANNLLDLVEKYGLDEEGRFDRERAKSVILPCLHTVNPTMVEDED